MKVNDEFHSGVLIVELFLELFLIDHQSHDFPMKQKELILVVIGSFLDDFLGLDLIKIKDFVNVVNKFLFCFQDLLFRFKNLSKIKDTCWW